MCAWARASGRRGSAGRPARRAARDAARGHDLASPSAISSSVPPRCTVPARAALRRPPRDRAVERPVDLEGARAVAVSGQAAAVAPGSRAADPPDRRGVEVEQQAARAAARRAIHRPPGHELAAQGSRRGGQRIGEAAPAAHRPADGVPGRHQQTEAGGERPLQRQEAWAASPRTAPALVEPGVPPPTDGATGPGGPKRVRATGWRGARSSGPRTSGETSGAATSGPRCGSRRARRVRGRRGPFSECTNGRRPSVQRVGQRRRGVHPRRRWREGRERRNGDPATRGWMAEHTSCTNPGSVSSADRVPRRPVGGLDHQHRARPRPSPSRRPARWGRSR